MPYEVSTRHVEARPVAAVATSATQDTLADVIFACLDQVWPALRDQDVKSGHNVVIYRDGLNAIEVGVETLDPFVARGDVLAVTTPGGEVVTTVHRGPYTGLASAYRALDAWCAANHRTASVAWEVYGDWDDDPDKLRTDVFRVLASS